MSKGLKSVLQSLWQRTARALTPPKYPVHAIEAPALERFAHERFVDCLVDPPRGLVTLQCVDGCVVPTAFTPLDHDDDDVGRAAPAGRRIHCVPRNQSLLLFDPNGRLIARIDVVEAATATTAPVRAGEPVTTH
jgi:hypothetical protein